MKQSERPEGRMVRISVRNLVEFILRSGDIDNRRSGAAQKDAMSAGSRIHRKIQKRMGAGYRAEVSLKGSAVDEESGITLEVYGRADGILEADDLITIDEIKGMYTDVKKLSEPIPVHLAQAMCYGHFYCETHEIPGVCLQLTYCNLDTEEIKRFQTVKTREELAGWFIKITREYFKWIRFSCRHEELRNETIRMLEFPYPYREGQRPLVAAVYKTIIQGKHLYIQAPTGIGKTLAVMFPAIRAIGEGRGEKLFYLTAKTITQTVAEHTLRLLRERGLVFSSVTITAKEKLCLTESHACNPVDCPYAKGHFDRINDAVYEILQTNTELTREKILEYARIFRVCPFELCLDLSSWTDGIICDYNYVFDPNVRLKRYFADGAQSGGIFLIDEAHNLVSRAREMYSAAVRKDDFLLVKRILRGHEKKLTRALDSCSRTLLSLKRSCEETAVLNDVTVLAAGIRSAFAELETFLEDYADFPDRETVLNFYFCLRDFINAYDRLDAHCRIYAGDEPESGFYVRLFCVDPSALLSECMSQGNSTILFSATLLPVLYYKKLLTGDPDDYAVYAYSPFEERKRLLMVARDVSSRYTRRNEGEYRKIADYIRAVTESRKGNYMIFFPSYQYMEAVERQLDEDGLNADLILQGRRMSESEREEFLREFERERDHSLAAFCVMGGVFSEGIDLREERLIGVIIIGTGLPMVCAEQEILRQYFDENGERGFDFAYQYPGMNKVLQAAGRVIRTPEDRGVILLLDDRFLRREYLELFPREWEHYHLVDRTNVRDCLRDFWAAQEAP